MHKLYFLFFNFQEILKENTYRSCPWYIKMYEGILFKFYYLRQEIHLYKVHLILTYCMCLGIYTRYFILQLVIHVQFSTVVYCTHTCEGIYYFFNINKYTFTHIHYIYTYTCIQYAREVIIVYLRHFQEGMHN